MNDNRPCANCKYCDKSSFPAFWVCHKLEIKLDYSRIWIIKKIGCLLKEVKNE